MMKNELMIITTTKSKARTAVTLVLVLILLVLILTWQTLNRDTGGIDYVALEDCIQTELSNLWFSTRNRRMNVINMCHRIYGR